MIHPAISFAGAGRVASALCKKSFNEGFRVELIASPSENSGRSLASSCGATWSSGLRFPDSTGLIIVAVPDHKLKDVLDKIVCRNDTIVVHTAGSIGLEVFPPHLKRRGVFYPLQTFSAGREVEFKGLPLFIESSDKQSSAILENLSEAIGCKTYFVGTEQRRMLHLAAVFICNFTNHMLTEGRNVAARAGFPFEILYPLLQETVSKARELGPENSQTGPAVRNDQNTIDRHMELLSYSPGLERLYREITISIINYYNKS